MSRSVMRVALVALLLLVVSFNGVRASIPPNDPDTVPVKVGAWNVQVFGISKMEDPGVPEVLVSTMNGYDLLLFQEIRDASQTAFPNLMDMLRSAGNRAYTSTVSERLGRTTSKEQYAYVYDPAVLELVTAYVYPDPNDAFERPPYVAHWRHLASGTTFATIGLHAKPDDVVAELDAIPSVYTDARNGAIGSAEVNFLLLGDLNADCTYLSPVEQSDLTLVIDPLWVWLISSDVDTTTTNTNCAYDHFVVTQPLERLQETNSASVDRFDVTLNLDDDTTPTVREVSDHYPITLTFRMPKGDGDKGGSGSRAWIAAAVLIPLIVVVGLGAVIVYRRKRGYKSAFRYSAAQVLREY